VYTFTRVLGLYRGSAKRHMLGPEPGGKFWGIDPFPWGQPDSGKKVIYLDEDTFFQRHDRVWLGVLNVGELWWQPIQSPRELDSFNFQFVDEINGLGETVIVIRPFLPQLYAIKRGYRYFAPRLMRCEECGRRVGSVRWHQIAHCDDCWWACSTCLGGNASLHRQWKL
jgi:hypothetical protein